MLAMLISTGVALIVSLFGTPVLIRILRKRNFGQFIRQDGPTAHHTKRGTPTMGGLIIIGASLTGIACAYLQNWQMPSQSAWLLLFLYVGLGLIGFLDDFIKISKKRSLGLNPTAKIIGQLLIGSIFAAGCLIGPDENGFTAGSTAISFLRDSSIDLAIWGPAIGIALFLVWANFLISAWSNAVNLTDGLDGLATGSCLFAFGAYTAVTIWEFYQRCRPVTGVLTDACYSVRDPRDLAIISAAIVGACFGFLWWNTSPAQIFMGDTGSLALGGAFAGLSILSRTEFLAVIIGGLFVLIVLSDVIQIGFFKLTRRRVFRMAPLHHHFELKGWPEVTIVVRFWIIAGLFAILGIGIFYAEWVLRMPNYV